MRALRAELRHAASGLLAVPVRSLLLAGAPRSSPACGRTDPLLYCRLTSSAPPPTTAGLPDCKLARAQEILSPWPYQYSVQSQLPPPIVVRAEPSVWRRTRTRAATATRCTHAHGLGCTRAWRIRNSARGGAPYRCIHILFASRPLLPRAIMSPAQPRTRAGAVIQRRGRGCSTCLSKWSSGRRRRRRRRRRLTLVIVTASLKPLLRSRKPCEPSGVIMAY